MDAADPVVRPAIGLAPQAVEDRQLVLEQIRAFLDRREGQAQLPVLVVVPAGPDPDFDATAAHLVHGRHDLRQDARMAERDRRHEHAQTDPLGLAGQASDDGPRVGRRLPGRSGKAREVVGAKVRIEAVRLRALRGGELIGVGHPLLGLGHQGVAHPELLHASVNHPG